MKTATCCSFLCEAPTVRQAIYGKVGPPSLGSNGPQTSQIANVFTFVSPMCIQVPKSRTQKMKGGENNRGDNLCACPVLPRAYAPLPKAFLLREGKAGNSTLQNLSQKMPTRRRKTYKHGPPESSILLSPLQERGTRLE